jgi:hypothetical protein
MGCRYIFFREQPDLIYLHLKEILTLDQLLGTIVENLKSDIKGKSFEIFLYHFWKKSNVFNNFLYYVYRSNEKVKQMPTCF